MNEIEVAGKTDTPNFSLDPVGHPVPLHTDFSATVDGTDGDTYLHPVKATLGKSVINCEGSVTHVPNQGHLIQLNIDAPNARIEDILALAINSDKPFMTGPAQIKAKLTIPPGKFKVLQKMILDGKVEIKNANWSDPKVRDKLESLSRHAEGKPGQEDAGSSVANLMGDFKLAKAIIDFRSLTFSVPGANLDLVGSYDIGEGNLDFNWAPTAAGEAVADGDREEVVFPEGGRSFLQQRRRGDVAADHDYRETGGADAWSFGVPQDIQAVAGRG